MTELVRVELEDGSRTNVGRSFAETHELTILDESPLDESGRFKPVESAIEVEEASPPAGNAGRDEWAKYVVESGNATEDEIAEMGRDDLRDTFGAGA